MDIMDRLKGPRRNLPIGIQSFERLRRDGYLYVDKTAFVYELASTGNPYFLSRPRRFGKSLLLSTLEAYFCGKKELFEGLAIEQLETEWNEHAVLHLDLNAEDYSEIEGLRNGLELQLRSWEKVYGTSEEGLSYSGRFMQVIKEAYRQTGRGVVVLIDEYDKPLLRSMHNPELQENGCIILEPRELAVPESISARTLADMDRAVSNFKRGDVSPAIDLSDF